MLLSERYTLQQLCELVADKDASFASPVLAAAAHPTQRLRIRALSPFRSLLARVCQQTGAPAHHSEPASERAQWLDNAAIGLALCTVSWRYPRRQECRLNTGPTRLDGVHRFGRTGRDLNSRPLDPQAARSAFLVVADGCILQRLPWPAAHCADRATSGNLRQQTGLAGKK